MDFLRNRWSKISKKGKAHHMLLGASLYRQVPLVVFIVFTMEMINQYRNLNGMHLLINIGVKIFLAYLIGVYIGNLEWAFLEKLFNNRFKTDIEFRINYVFIYGICMFGTIILLGNIDPYFMSVRRIVYSLLIYGLVAVIWGVMMSYSVSKNILKEQGQ